MLLPHERRCKHATGPLQRSMALGRCGHACRLTATTSPSTFWSDFRSRSKATAQVRRLAMGRAGSRTFKHLAHRDSPAAAAARSGQLGSTSNRGRAGSASRSIRRSSHALRMQRTASTESAFHVCMRYVHQSPIARSSHAPFLLPEAAPPHRPRLSACYSPLATSYRSRLASLALSLSRSFSRSPSSPVAQAWPSAASTSSTPRSPNSTAPSR